MCEAFVNGVYIEKIPHSLLLLDTLYSKFFLFSAESNCKPFPNSDLKPHRLIRQLIWFLTSELDQTSAATPRADWKLVGPRIRSLLRVVHSICPTMRRELTVEKREIAKALEGLGLHGLVNFADRSLIDIGEAIRSELLAHYRAMKCLCHQMEKFMTKKSHHCVQNGRDRASPSYAINDIKAPVPSQSSHQRLMNLKLSEIKGRMKRNEYMLQILQACLHNTNLESLERILQRRIRYDRDILTQFDFLTRHNPTYALANEDPIVSYVLVLFNKGYERLLKLMPNSGGSEEEERKASTGIIQRKEHACCMNGRNVATTTDAPSMMNGMSYTGSELITGYSGSSDEEAMVGPFMEPSSKKIQLNEPPNGKMNGIDPVSHSTTNGNAGNRYRPNQYRRSSSIPTPGNFPVPQRRSCSKMSIFCSPSMVVKRRSPLVNGWASSPGSNEKICSSLPCLNDFIRSGEDNGYLDDSRRLLQGCPGACLNATACYKEENELAQLRAEVQELRGSLRCVQKQLKQQKSQYCSSSALNLNAANGTLDGPISDSNVTGLIERYAELYVRDRIETMEELNRFPELQGAQDLQDKIMLSVVVLSFRFVRQDITKTKEDVMIAVKEGRSAQDLEKESNSPAADLLQHLSRYLREKAEMDNCASTVQQVSDQLWDTLYDFCSLKSCHRLNEFIRDCAKLAWELGTAVPAYTIEFDDTQRELQFPHVLRDTRRYIWPALIEANTGKVAYLL